MGEVSAPNPSSRMSTRSHFLMPRDISGPATETRTPTSSASLSAAMGCSGSLPPSGSASRQGESWRAGGESSGRRAWNERSDAFLRQGVFSCYRVVDDRTPMPGGQKEFSEQDWRRLLYLSHTDKKRAFEEYAGHYLSTSGQIYWSGTHQLRG